MSKPTKYPEATAESLDLNEAMAFDPLVSDPLIDAFKMDVDRTLLRENLKLTFQERSEKFWAFMQGIYEIRGAAAPERKVWR